jgi:hypothetical protein
MVLTIRKVSSRTLNLDILKALYHNDISGTYNFPFTTSLMSLSNADRKFRVKILFLPIRYWSLVHEQYQYLYKNNTVLSR